MKCICSSPSIEEVVIIFAHDAELGSLCEISVNKLTIQAEKGLSNEAEEEICKLLQRNKVLKQLEVNNIYLHLALSLCEFNMGGIADLM